MSFVEIFLISIFSIFQCFFGVGLLLLGTPTFLLLGYDFFDVLNILLPYSIIISALQIISKKKKNYEFGKKILIHSIPFLLIGLFTIEIIQKKINFVFIISLFLIIFSILNLIKYKRKKICIKNINLSLKFLGLFHGLSNLGGSILTLIASNIDNNKNIIRYNISVGYLIFALFQLFFINFLFKQINFEYLYFLWIPILIYILSEKIFLKFNNKFYIFFLNIFTLVYGIYLCFTS